MRRTIGDIGLRHQKERGAFLLTLDIVFLTRRRTSAKAKPLTASRRDSRRPAEDVLKIIEFDPAHAVKITMRRAWGSGAVGEGDVYGAQQHVPLMEHAVPWEDA
jgi:hypothetical protein